MVKEVRSARHTEGPTNDIIQPPAGHWIRSSGPAQFTVLVLFAIAIATVLFRPLVLFTVLVLFATSSIQTIQCRSLFE